MDIYIVLIGCLYILIFLPAYLLFRGDAKLDKVIRMLPPPEPRTPGRNYTAPESPPKETAPPTAPAPEMLKPVLYSPFRQYKTGYKVPHMFILTVKGAILRYSIYIKERNYISDTETGFDILRHMALDMATCTEYNNHPNDNKPGYYNNISDNNPVQIEINGVRRGIHPQSLPFMDNPNGFCPSALAELCLKRAVLEITGVNIDFYPPRQTP